MHGFSRPGEVLAWQPVGEVKAKHYEEAINREKEESLMLETVLWSWKF